MIFSVPSTLSEHPGSSWSTWDDLTASWASQTTFSSLLSRELLELLLHQTWWNYLLSVLTKHKEIINFTTMSLHHQRSSRIMAPPTTRGYKANARTLLRRSSCAFDPVDISCACLRSVVFVWSNSRFNSVSRRCHINFISYCTAPRNSWLSLKTTVVVFTPSLADLSPFKASRVGVSQKAPAQFKLIFVNFCKNSSELTTVSDRAIFLLH